MLDGAACADGSFSKPFGASEFPVAPMYSACDTATTMEHDDSFGINEESDNVSREPVVPILVRLFAVKNKMVYYDIFEIF